MKIDLSKPEGNVFALIAQACLLNTKAGLKPDQVRAKRNALLTKNSYEEVLDAIQKEHPQIIFVNDPRK
jgi:hypothetical protein